MSINHVALPTDSDLKASLSRGSLLQSDIGVRPSNLPHDDATHNPSDEPRRAIRSLLESFRKPSEVRRNYLESE